MATVDKWMPFLLLGGALWFISRDGFLRPVAADDGARPWDTHDPSYTSAGGTSSVQGAVDTVQVSQRGNELGLQAHRIERANGATVDVQVDWTNNTIDFQGAAISWPARVLVELGHSTGFGFGGWDDMNGLLGGTGGSASFSDLSSSPGTHTDGFSLRMGEETNFPTDWDVRVRLEMQGSTEVGTPDGIWQEVGRATHEDAVRSIRTVGPSIVRGDVNDIEVGASGAASAGPDGASDPIGIGGWQSLAYSYQSTAPRTTYYQRGLPMKKLGMSQQRPPWGMVGHPDVRQWPRSDRNPMLPGVKIMVRQGRISAGSPIGPGRRMYAI